MSRTRTDSTDRSLSVKIDPNAPDGFVVHSFAADDPLECRDHVRTKLGLAPFEPKKSSGNANGSAGTWTKVGEHIYRDASGTPYLLVRKFRDEAGKKQFAQSHWDGEQWAKGKPNGRKVPYRLPELIAAAPSVPIYFCEGEKDVENLVKLGFTATTASEGANAAWDPALTPHFKDRQVVILPDADAPGRKHAQKIARALDGVAASVRVLDLFPDRADGSDVSDFLQHDPAGVRLAKLGREASLWTSPVAGDDRQDSGGGDEMLIAELAALPRLAYAKRRKDAAKTLGIGLSELDKVVAEARGSTRDEQQPEHWHVQRWSEPVSTGDLLDELSALYSKHVILPDHGAIAMALWCLHAWAIDSAYCSPFLMFASPEPRCGKSTAMALIKWTGPRTVLASNVSPAAIYRYIEAEHPTVLFDEAETFARNEETRGILNSGHNRDTSFVIRCEGDANEPKRFSTWSPKAIASIGKLAATLRDRAIILPMKRKKRGERVAKLRGRDTESFRTLREKARRWAEDNVDALKNADPALPDALNDRAADSWEPLIAIADLAGGDWPALARAAALRLSGDAVEPTSIGTQLLAAIKGVFNSLDVDRITSKALAEALALDEDGPWASYGKSGKPITQRQIASLLDRYNVRPDSIRIGQGTKKGYLLAWLTDAFETYLDAPALRSGTPEHANKDGHNFDFPSGTQPELFRIKNSEKSGNDGPCSGVPDQNTPQRDKEQDDAQTASEPCSPIMDHEEDRSCRYCKGPLDNTEQFVAISGQGYWLHPDCQAPFLETRDKP